MTEVTIERTPTSGPDSEAAEPPRHAPKVEVDGTPPRDAGMADFVRVEGVRKTWGDVVALERESLAVGEGEFVTILGPSGCGKTTLLRVIAGLEVPDEGIVHLAGRDVTREPVSRRGCGIVFQSYALFPNLSVNANVGYGLRRRATTKQERVERVREMLRLVGLPDIGHKYPAQLSGGQQQRVALARALAVSPSILLLDEPLSALDAKERVRLRHGLRQLQQELGITTIMVTHDQEEALTMADRIVVMDHGRITQVGAPRELYTAPSTPFVADFVGSMNFLGSWRVERDGVLATDHTQLRAMRIAPDVATGDEVTVAVRPEHVVIDEIGRAESPVVNRLPIRVDAVEYRGPTTRVHMSLAVRGPMLGRTILADLPSEHVPQLALRPGQDREVMIEPEHLLTYRAGTTEE
jgi:iron(III) transport system ATP-binding protein